MPPHFCVNGHRKTPRTWKLNSQGYGRCLVCDRDAQRLRRQMAENAKHQEIVYDDQGNRLVRDVRPSTDFIDNEAVLPF